jgi:predicted phage-related endonuclease
MPDDMTTAELDEVKDAIDTARQARRLVKKWEAIQKQAEETLTEALGDADAGTVGGRTVLTHKQITRTNWDSEKLKADLGLIAEQYRRPVTYRKFDYLGDET